MIRLPPNVVATSSSLFATDLVNFLHQNQRPITNREAFTRSKSLGNRRRPAITEIGRLVQGSSSKMPGSFASGKDSNKSYGNSHNDRPVIPTIAQSHMITCRDFDASARLAVRLCRSCGNRIRDLSSDEGISNDCQKDARTSVDVYTNICNIFWKLNLICGDHDVTPVDFKSLWPSEEKLKSLLPEFCSAVPGSIEILCQMSVFTGIDQLLKQLVQLNIIGINQIFDNGSGLLHMACVAHNFNAVEFLLQSGIDPNIRDSYGHTAIEICTDPQISNFLVSTVHGEQIGNHRKVKPATLHDKQKMFNVAQNPADFEKLLRKLKTIEFDVNKETDNTGDLLVHVAVKQGLKQLSCLLVLVEKFGADINIRNIDGLTCLMLAASLGHTVLVDSLVCVAGAKLDVRNCHNGWTALHYACCDGHVDVVGVLLKRGCDFNLEDNSGVLADELAMQCGSRDCHDAIVMKREVHMATLRGLVKENKLTSDEHRMHPSDQYMTDYSGYTLLMIAAHAGRIDSLKFLLTLPHPPVNAQHEKTLRTALGYAVFSRKTEIVQLLLNNEANPSIPDKDGLLPLHFAIINDDLPMVEVLLQCPAALTRLDKALKFAMNPTLELILKAAVCRRQHEIVTPALFSMALNGDANGIYNLLERGDVVNEMNDMQEWPMFIAVDKGHLDVVELLYQWNGDIVSRHPRDGSNVLHRCCEHGYLEIARFLLWEYKSRQAEILHIYDDAPVNQLNAHGYTPLMLAALKGHEELVRLLLDNGASTCVLQPHGHLYQCDEFPSIQQLLDDYRNRHSEEVFKAINDKKNGLKTLMNIFQLKHDHNLVDVTTRDTPLMRACHLGHVDIVKFLLLSAKYALNNDFLSRSTTFHDSFNSSSDFPIDDSYSLLPPTEVMMYEDNNAALMESIRTVSEANSIIDGHIVNHMYATSQRDGRTAFHRAVEWKDNTTCLECLLDFEVMAVNVQDKEGLSPLHLACRLNRKSIVKKLVSVTCVDLNSRTLDGSLVEELTKNKTLVTMVQRARSQQSSRNIPSLLNLARPLFRLSIDANIDEASSSSESEAVDFDRINERFTQLMQNSITFGPDAFAHLH